MVDVPHADAVRNEPLLTLKTKLPALPPLPEAVDRNAGNSVLEFSTVGSSHWSGLSGRGRDLLGERERARGDARLGVPLEPALIHEFGEVVHIRPTKEAVHGLHFGDEPTKSGAVVWRLFVEADPAAIGEAVQHHQPGAADEV